MKLGGYEVLGEVGRGGAGIVYRGRAPDGADVALKLLPATDASSLDHFERERRLLATLGEGDGFVPLVDAGSAAGRPFVVMPFLEGGTLKERLRRGPLTPGEALELLRLLAGALAKAHAKGIVHRDLKPANVIFSRDGRPFVSDLGLARHFRRDLPGASQSRSLTKTGTIAGTLGYMAPEQLDDARRATPRSDVFALGVIAFECLTGELPYEGSSLAAYVSSLDRASAPSLGKLRPELPGALARAVERALAPDPEERFDDASSLLRALEAVTVEPRRGRARIVALAGALVLLAAAGSALLFLPSGPGAQELVVDARARLAARDLDGALALATRAAERDPGLALAWAVRADAESQRKEDDLAFADAEKAIALDKSCGLALGVRGSVLLERGDHARAIADLARAVELDDGNASFRAKLGLARALQGDVDAGLRDLDRAVELDRGSAAGWRDRGTARTIKGDTAGAVSDLSRSIELEPGHADTLLVRARLRYLQRDHRGAIADYTRVIALDPKVAEAWLGRAEARTGLSDSDGALADLDEVIRLGGGTGPERRAEAHYDRGIIRQGKGDARGAREDFERAVAIAPQSLLGKAAQRQLETLGKP
ncbi:protein kinase [bacterium]|nr:protein kinase [bacterium]